MNMKNKYKLKMARIANSHQRERRNKNIIIFLLSFFVVLVVFILFRKLFYSLELKPQTWIEIWHNLPAYIVFALIAAIFITIYECYFTEWELKKDEDEDEDKYEKKQKK